MYFCNRQGNLVTHYYYEAYQLIFQSELKFVELIPLYPPAEMQANVYISFGEVSSLGLSLARTKGVTYQANMNEFWLNVPNTARFLVTHGKNIIIQPIDGADEDSIRLFLLGSCLGALLMQRGLCVMHANVIRFDAFACAFAGLTGAGKSTLAAAFYKKGYDLLTDDVCAIDAKGYVIPGFPQLKLWKDAAKALEIDVKHRRKIRSVIEKYAIPLEKQFFNQTIPLKVIYVLNSHNKTNITFRQCTGIEKFLTLHNQSYRRYFLEGLGLTQQHRLHCVQLARQVSLTQIIRPDTGYSMDKLIPMIEYDLLKQENECVV